MSDSLSDLLHAGSDRLRPTLPPAQSVRRMAERRRRNRRIAAVVTPAVLAALVLWLGAAGQLRNSATPPSPATPGPHPSRVLTLTSDPFLTEEEGIPVRPGAAPVALSPCVISPETRDATESGAATYRRRGGPPFANEYVTRFESVAAAHHAVIDAWRQFRRCPTPPNAGTHPIPRPGPPTTIYGLSELFTNQLVGFARPHRNNPMSMYSLRVGRWRNVVVVLESTGTNDRPDYVLWRAMIKATGRRPRTATP